MALNGHNKQNLTDDCFLRVEDVRNYKHLIRAHDIIWLKVDDDIISVYVSPDLHTSPFTITGSLTNLLQLLPIHHFIRVRRELAVNKEFINRIEGKSVVLKNEELLVFSRRCYTTFLKSA